MKDRVINLALVVLACAILFLCAVACRTQVPISRADTVTKTVIKEILHDTTVYLTDSSGFRALLECDSLGEIKVKQIQDFYAGQFVKPKIVIRDNYVNVDCLIDSAAVYVAWKVRYEATESKVTTVQVVKENYVTGFQWAQIWAGRLFAVLILLWLAYKVLKRYTALKLP